MKSATVMKSLEQVIQEYQAQGFKICTILGDRQFQSIEQPMESRGINMSIFAMNKHVSEI